MRGSVGHGLAGSLAVVGTSGLGTFLRQDFAGWGARR